MTSRQVLGRLDCPRSGINLREVAPRKATISTISSPVEIIDSSENAIIILLINTNLHLEDTLSNSRSKRNLFSFKMYAIIGTILRH